MPIGVGSFSGDHKAVDADIYVASSEAVYAGVMVAPETVKRIKSAQRKLSGKLDLEMTLNFEKGEKPIPQLVALSAYMTGIESQNAPTIAGRISIEKVAKFRLSDVSNSQLSEGQFVPVLVTADFLENLVTKMKQG